MNTLYKHLNYEPYVVFKDNCFVSIGLSFDNVDIETRDRYEEVIWVYNFICNKDLTFRSKY